MLKSRGFFLPERKINLDMLAFTKPATTAIEQIEFLKSRGLIISDEDQALSFLKVVSFFRLTPYMRALQIKIQEKHHFKQDATFEKLIRLYEFDRQLRLLVIDAIERIEVAVRASIATELCKEYGTHWYLDAEHFKTNYNHSRLVQTIQKKQETALVYYERECARINRLTTVDLSHKTALKNKRKQENYARYYPLTYNIPTLMPAWAMLEELSFGDLSRMYEGLAKDIDKKKIARSFELYPPLLDSWLHTITEVRNICAHHARLWNRELGIIPVNPTIKGFSWPSYLEATHQHTRLSIVLSILTHMMRNINSKNIWQEQLFSLFEIFNEIPVGKMGLPNDWKVDIFWK